MGSLRRGAATVLLASLGLAGCATDPDPDEAVDTDVVADTDPPAVDSDDACGLYTWETVGAPFLATWCGPCHGPDLSPAQRQEAPPEVILASEGDALQWAARIRARALGPSPTMPPVPGPSVEEIARMATYLDCLTRR